MNKLTEALGSVMDYLYRIASTLSEKFTGDNSGSGLVMLIFYLVALIIILLLLKFAARTIKNIFRVIFSKPNKKTPASTPVTAEASPNNVSVESVDPSKTLGPEEPKNEPNALSVIENFDDTQPLEALTKSFNKLNTIGEDKTPPQHILKTPPSFATRKIEPVPLSETEHATINERATNKSLPELNALLAFTNNEQAQISNKLVSIQDETDKAHADRESLAKKELSAINKHNIAVDEYAALFEDINKSKSETSQKYLELRNFISNIEAKKAALYESIADIEKDIASLPESLEAFEKTCDDQRRTFVLSIQKKEEVLTALKDDYTSLSAARVKKETSIAELYEAQIKTTAEKAFHDELVAVLVIRTEELAKLEKERLARLEAERLAKEEEVRAKEREKQEAIAKAKAEAEAKAKAEAEAKAKAAEEAKRAAESAIQAKESSESDVDKLKTQIQNRAASSYSLNFDNISQAMLERMANAKKKKGSSPDQAPALSDTADTANNSASASDTNNTEDANKPEKPDYVSQIKKQWAEENAHKQQWEKEQAQRKEDEERRKKELTKELSEDGFTEDSE